MTEPMRLTGLFLGAGASVEVGMPLVWELTEKLKNELTPDKLRELNAGWKVQGTGYPDSVVEDFASVLVRDEMHYESLLGYLEAQSRRFLPLLQPYHGLYSLIVEVVYHILRLRHALCLDMIERNLGSLEGIARLTETNMPLWIFSLNHDVLIECLAAKYGVLLHSGFGSGIITFPRRDRSGVKIGELRAESLSEAQLTAGMMFPQPGSQGINLLKIHGALDVFAYRDGKDFAKLLPDESTARGIIDMLRVAEEELLYIDPRRQYPVKTTNEITYADETGVMQFLRRTLVAGTHKFDNRHSQVLPQGFLKQFESNINFVSTLICIGYGFGDLHINQVLRDWLERSAERRLEIVSPEPSVPSFLLHLSPQVKLFPKAASDYLDDTTGIVRSRRELLERRLGRWFRKNRKDLNTEHKFLSFMRERQTASVRAALERIGSAFGEDGSLHFAGPERTAEQFAQQLLAENEISYEALLESFLLICDDESPCAASHSAAIMKSRRSDVMNDPTQHWNRPYAEQWLEQLRNMERCAWCGEHEKPLNREKLCAACVRTRRHAAKAKRETEAMPATATDHERWKQTRELRIAEKMIEICKGDGEHMEIILNGDLFDVVALEESLSDAAYAVCHQRNCFHGSASQLALTFTPEQRRILAYLFWKPRLADRKRRRMQMATRFLHREDLRTAEQESTSDAIAEDAN